MSKLLADNNTVKSTAVVKYSASQSPATFAQLQCNTDLNLPPANWLSNSASIYGLQHVLPHSTGFSSFRMAHMFPDCICEVDVVSDAENIKNLLKLPYSHGQVSMMVHRIENTLLIDEFDIYKHLLRTAEKEWEWLRKFFYENIRKSFNEKDRNLYMQNKSRIALQQKSLVSKFLYHSLVQKHDDNNVYEENVNKKQDSFSGPVLPDPTVEEEVPDPTSNHKYNRNVVWTFEDIQMLIGTDMPIFGGTTHPCISLRLRDMASPINVLTGIDYWLDNLMSNVPEVVMCYHLNGIVQKYELIKTEDLPNMENSKFSPTVIRDIAQNILSFLKSNATKAGHTYWLFKSKDDDVVKLYDLTFLCMDDNQSKEQNPFITPVAMLLYRVARNMKLNSEHKHLGTILMLLKNCIKLLQKEKYPQIVTSSHYMISDLYIPTNTDPVAPGLDHMENDDTESFYDDDDDNSDDLNEQTDDSAATKQLLLGNKFDSSNTNFVRKPPPPITGTIEERCQQALNHVLCGLGCLQYFPISDNISDENKSQESNNNQTETSTFAKQFQAIPMPYAKLEDLSNNNTKGKKQKKRKTKVHSNDSPNALLLKMNQEPIAKWRETECPPTSSWNIHLKTLLYEKACLIFAILAEQDYILERYGSSIKHIKLLVRCYEILQILRYSSQAVQESCVLGRAGDACFMMVKNWCNVGEYRQQLHEPSDVYEKILNHITSENCLEKSVITNNSSNNNNNNNNSVIMKNYNKIYKLLPVEFENIEQMLLISATCYEEALKSELVQDRNVLLRRLGNIQNELGVFYTHKATEDVDSHREYYNKAVNYLQNGIKTFDSVKDGANLALLYSNMGRLLRVCAHFCSTKQHIKNKRKTRAQEKMYFDKALENYQKALYALGERSNNAVVWDTVTWELCTALFTRASLLQDYPPSDIDSEQLEREIAEILHKALRYCDIETSGPRQPIYQYRVACIHHRLASLYHNAYRNMNSDNQQRRKHLFQLCKNHYDRACKYFLLLEQHVEYIKCTLERVALLEFLTKDISASIHTKIENHQYCLYLFIEIIPSLKVLVNIAKKRNSDKKAEEITESNKVSNNAADKADFINESESAAKTEAQLLVFVNTIEQQLQYALKMLAKLCLTKSSCDLSEKYKTLYSASLKLSNIDKSPLLLLSDLIKIMSKINNEKNDLIRCNTSSI